jgi:hypothetical protein
MKLPTLERARTIALLHRFFRTSLLVGRMPSLLGREIFPSHMLRTPARALEDAVLFVCDVERVLRSLEALDQRLIAFCVLEDRSEWEAARLFHRSQMELSRRLGEVLDLLHETFCRLGLLRRPEQAPPPKTETPVPRCQRIGGKDERQTERKSASQNPETTG